MHRFNLAWLAALMLANAHAQDRPLEEVIVTATFREQSLKDAPVSASVLSAQTLRDAGQQHFEDVLPLVPNLNWAAGSSRPRYFQIRGIGEREQYEGAPNPSVGFLIDDIDFSGIGMPATLFDVQQVEVLRGPQGTRYGANALAGLIVVRNQEPGEAFDVSAEASAGDYATRSLGAVITAPVDSMSSAWRLSVQQYRSDGFRRDAYLNRKDTNDRDELTARFKWRWNVSDDTRVDFTLLHVNLDNGYDGWSIDNSRISQADRPGKDSQRSTGVSARVSTALNGATLTMIGAYADSAIVNSFDGDWGNPILWAPFTYDYFERTTRARRTASVEARLASGNDEARAVNWLVGVYAMRLREQLGDSNTGTQLNPADPASLYILDDSLDSHYRATNVAVFGSLDGKFADRWHWSAGARLEQRDANYSDSGIQAGAPEVTAFDSRDHMFGGELSLSYELSARSSAYVSLSRGYKAGGFNLHTQPGTPKEYQPEFLWSLETGLKGSWLDGQIVATSALFYERRRDMQIRNGVQLTPGDPNSYVFITENASGGYNYGLESTLQWRATQSLSIESSLGLLRTRFIDYQPAAVDLSNRDQAQAPRYQFAVAGIWRSKTGWMTRIDLTGMDSFYFDVPPNDTRSPAYALTNVKVGYQAPHWSAYAWGRNIFDRTYAIRGFFFHNSPSIGSDQLYIQRGDPRTVGVTVNWQMR